ncbi:hypothetical protein [Kribbella sp. NPDC003557]|uniref:hypothetical protein n=1 Tax=Kribbella sp. NPDC003557 TaxID=3154449 RepID=UPI0033A3B01D
MKRWAVLPIAVLMLAGTATAHASGTATQRTAATCDVALSSFGPEGDPTTGLGPVRLASTSTQLGNGYGLDLSGYAVSGDRAYYWYYSLTNEAEVDPGLPRGSQPVGSGWSAYKALEVSQFAAKGATARNTAYGLSGDGTLRRWSFDINVPWRFKATGSAPGFASVKSMALISKTATYDTFLANTRGGALYTIRIPASSPMKPIVRPVRTRTWQGFEKLVATKCGQYGTFLVGIDFDTRTASQYAVGHTNGTSTVILGLGRRSGSFPARAYYRWATNPYEPLNGD